MSKAFLSSYDVRNLASGYSVLLCHRQVRWWAASSFTDGIFDAGAEYLSNSSHGCFVLICVFVSGGAHGAIEQVPYCSLAGKRESRLVAVFVFMVGEGVRSGLFLAMVELGCLVEALASRLMSHFGGAAQPGLKAGAPPLHGDAAGFRQGHGVCSQ